MKIRVLQQISTISIPRDNFGAIVKSGREGPPHRSSYMVDYEALTGLSLLRVPQQSVWPGAPRA
jgi:hypothetical protein